MKKVIICLVGLAAIMSLCSCGSLTHHIEGDKLRPETVEFAKHMREEPSWCDMGMTYDGVHHDTDKWYSRVVPFIIFWNWTTLGSFEKDKYFVARKVALFFPAFYIVRDARYDEQGIQKDTGMEWNLAFVIGYENFHRHSTDYWKTGVVWIPGAGPCIGFGPGYFQFLWIPFSEIN